MQNEASPAGLLGGLPVWVSDSHNTWPSLRIARSVPLGRLEWLWKSQGTSIRDSSTSARALFDVSVSHSHPIPNLQKLSHEWYRNPYVYILVTTVKQLDDSKDIIAWERIRLFLDSCREELHEYLIIVAISDTEVIHQRRIIDKLRAEVNLVARGRDRVVLVPPASIREEMRPITHLHHSPSHQDLLVRLRECTRDGVEARIRCYEDEVSRRYLSKNSSSWSFPKFMALKEAMSFVFIQLGRRDLALKLYDELHVTMSEANFLSSMKFCNCSATEAAQGVSNPDGKHHRAVLVQDSATELQIRTYLFARQTSLLLMDRKFSDVAERGLKFITVIARRCAEESLKGEEGVAATFRDTWVFIAARVLAASLAPAIPSQAEASHALSARLSTPRERHTARLIAGLHVHALKAFLGLVHIVLPGCLSPDDAPFVGNRKAMMAEVLSITEEKLKAALSDRKKAELLHSEIANAAASLYEMGGRARGAAALDGDAGMVCMRNNSYAEGESLLAAQCSRFANDHGWDELHKTSRLALARAEKELDRIQEYLVSCLCMLHMTRESHLGSQPPLETGEDDRVSSSAEFWMKEALITAAELPRVMKYKAEKLFDVSVQPNVRNWNEGDPGSATVVVKSDLPLSVSVDRVIMECRSVGVDSRRRSAFHKHSQGNYRSLTLKGSELVHGPTSSSDAATSDRPETFALISKEKITIGPGTTLIRVLSDEVPHCGLFKVTSVSLYLSKLKLVQAAGKVPMHSVVTTKNRVTGKVTASPVQTTMLADLVNCEVRFPIFAASRRKPAAFISFQSNKDLYLASESVQYVSLCIRAGEHGIVKGSKLRFSLLTDHDPSPGPEAVVRFANSVRASSSNAIYLLSVVPNEETGTNLDVGDSVFDRELGPNETMECQVALRVSTEEGRVQPDLDFDPNCFSITLHVRLLCHEKSASRSRPFSCESQGRLTFLAPVEVSAHTEMHSCWDEASVNRSIALDGTSLSEGGSIICSVTSRVGSGDTLILRQATLETPSWLELRPNEEPTHDSLLPIELSAFSSFNCIFDILERVQDSPPYHGQVSDASEPYETVAMQHRASREYSSASDLTKSQMDSEIWKYGPPPDDSSSSSEGLVEQVNFGANTTMPPTGKADQRTLDHASALSNIAVEDLDTVRGPDAPGVVDLSQERSQRLTRALESSSMLSRDRARPNDLATLRLYVEISGVTGALCVERQICMDSFRMAKKRYRVERSIHKVGKSGDVMKLCFQIQSAAEKRTYYEDTEQETTLQFEVDANPEIWLVVGRQRGKCTIRRNCIAAEEVNMIPLTCGWHPVPCLRLFTTDGQALPFSRYENVDEYKEVVVVPSVAIVGGCAISDECDGEAKTANERGNMPVVIASDSFFRS